MRVREDVHGEADHCLSDIGRKLCEHRRVVVVSDCLDDGAGALDGVTGEDWGLSACDHRVEDNGRTDTGTDKDTVATELHHQRGVSRGGDSACSERDDRETTETGSLLEQVEGRLDVLGESVKLLVRHHRGTTDIGHDCALVTDCLDNVACSCLALCADHTVSLKSAAIDPEDKH